jgi:hypothetical protein
MAYQLPPSYSRSKNGLSYGDQLSHPVSMLLCFRTVAILGRLTSVILDIYLKMINSERRCQSQLHPLSGKHGY